MDCKELTLRLCAADGTSGAEDDAARLAQELLSPYGATTIDRMGNVLCELRPCAGKEHRYLLDAHLDEIGLIVTNLTLEGFLRVSNVGGVDRRLLAACEVTVHGKRPLHGVICSTPPHLQGGGEAKNVKIDEVLIDIGLDGARAREEVSPGDRVTFFARPREMTGGMITGKALDDRAGCAVLLRVAELLQGKELDCGVLIALTVQEETSHTGAKTAGLTFAPTHGVVVDVTFGRTPDADSWRTYELGKGPTISYAPILCDAMNRRFEQIAAAQSIPFQREVMGGGHTGTNADEVVTLGEGVSTALISIPLTYMHTPVEQVCPQDLEDAARLIAEYLIAEEGVSC